MVKSHHAETLRTLLETKASATTKAMARKRRRRGAPDVATRRRIRRPLPAHPRPPPVSAVTSRPGDHENVPARSVVADQEPTARVESNVHRPQPVRPPSAFAFTVLHDVDGRDVRDVPAFHGETSWARGPPCVPSAAIGSTTRGARRPYSPATPFYCFARSDIASTRSRVNRKPGPTARCAPASPRGRHGVGPAPRVGVDAVVHETRPRPHRPFRRAAPGAAKSVPNWVQQ